MIGKLAEATGVPASSIRFYEKHGLIPPPERQENGYRDYPDTMVSRLRTIAMSKSLGFSLSEIRRLLPNDPADQIARSDVVDHLQDKLCDIDQKIRHLKEIRKTVEQILTYMRDPNAKGC